MDPTLDIMYMDPSPDIPDMDPSPDIQRIWILHRIRPGPTPYIPNMNSSPSYTEYGQILDHRIYRIVIHLNKHYRHGKRPFCVFNKQQFLVGSTFRNIYQKCILTKSKTSSPLKVYVPENFARFHRYACAALGEVPVSLPCQPCREYQSWSSSRGVLVVEYQSWSTSRGVLVVGPAGTGGRLSPLQETQGIESAK